MTACFAPTLWRLTVLSVCLADSLELEVPQGQWLQQPLSLHSVNGTLDVTLVFDQHLFKGPGFDVWTRAFNNSVPAPTLRVKAGDVLRIKLINKLGPNGPTSPLRPDYFGRVNTTNLHFHGYHGSPKCGNDPARPDVCSDNVLIDVPPQTDQQYEYHLQDDLAAGLFWYHPHCEGSTAIQVSAGAAGAIVIEDGVQDAVPTWLSGMDEVVMVLQEVFMRDCNISGIRFKGCPGTPGLEAMAGGNLSKVHITGDAPVMWYFMINGQYLPRVNMTAGVWQRWRFVMAGANTNLRLQLPGCELQLLAKDGIFVSPMPRPLGNASALAADAMFPPAPGPVGPSTIFLSPANRAEVAVRCPAGSFAFVSVVEDGLPGQPTFPGPDGMNATLATVVVTEPASPAPNVELTPVKPWRPEYLKDLTTLPDSAVDVDNKLTLELIFNGPQSLSLNGRKFPGLPDPNNASSYLNKYKVGTVQEWTYAPSGTHPFHMHVNPMQLMSYPAASNYNTWFQVGDFHDVLRAPNGGGHTTFRFFAHGYSGNIVMHCHILRHEDMGLMAVSIIEEPNITTLI